MFSKIMDRVDAGQKKYNCSKCHESFMTRAFLDEHKTTSHPGVERASWEQKTDRSS